MKVYCNAKYCNNHQGGGCKLDHIIVDNDRVCQGKYRRVRTTEDMVVEWIRQKAIVFETDEEA